MKTTTEKMSARGARLPDGQGSALGGNKAPKWKGVVVSNKMAKTIVVAVNTLKTHPKYLKQYRSTKRYKVHVDENTYAVGDTVIFQECRPISRDKRHKVVAA